MDKIYAGIYIAITILPNYFGVSLPIEATGSITIIFMSLLALEYKKKEKLTKTYEIEKKLTELENKVNTISSVDKYRGVRR